MCTPTTTPAVRTAALPRRTTSRLAGVLLVVLATVLAETAGTTQAQERGFHLFYRADAIPGAIGRWQLQRGTPLPGYFQPVEIQAPPGAEISLAVSGNFDEPAVAPALRGLQVASVYRLRIRNIPLRPGLEVFPTIELIDRIYPPCGAEQNFPIPIHFSAEDLELAASGRYITRVVYVENPHDAVPIATNPREPQSFDVAPEDDPLQVADRMGRPVAIVRMGGRIPSANTGPGDPFYFGSPAFVRFEPKSPASDAVVAKPDAVRVSHQTDVSGSLGRLSNRSEVSP